MARYTLPSLLQGHPPSLQLGHPDVASGRYSCAVRAYGATTSPVSMSPREGVLTSLRNHHHTRLPTFVSRQASAVPHPSIPSPPPRTLFPSRGPAVYSPTHPAPTTPPSRRGEGIGERPVCSVATSGCPTRSEDGFPAGARNIPPRPAQPNSKQKASYREVGGVRRAADGNRTRVSGLGSVRSTIELQPHLFQCIALACRA